MTLKDYYDIITFELKDYKLPWEYLRIQINNARREIAKRTRCLHCVSTISSVVGDNMYRIPHSEQNDAYVDLVDVLDVTYDSKPLQWVNPHEMTYKAYIVVQSTPEYWTYYGGESQLTGYIQLEPTPNEVKTISVRAIQFPQPLEASAQSCELNDVIQKIVIDQVVAEILLKRGQPEGRTLLREVEKRIYQNTWLKSL